MTTKARLEIHELSFPIDGYNFNVQIWRSPDNGNTWYYAGEGKYLKTIQEVLAYQSDFLKTHA